MQSLVYEDDHPSVQRQLNPRCIEVKTFKLVISPQIFAALNFFSSYILFPRTNLIIHHPELTAPPQQHSPLILHLLPIHHVPLRRRRNPLHRQLSPRLRQTSPHQSRLPLQTLRLQHAPTDSQCPLQSKRSNHSTSNRSTEKHAAEGNAGGKSSTTTRGEVTRASGADNDVG